jgi:hypothetical protein
MVDKINRARQALVKKLPRVNHTEATCAVLQMFSGGLIKSKVGTRLDFMVNTFKKNAETIERVSDMDSKRTKVLRDMMVAAVRSI